MPATSTRSRSCCTPRASTTTSAGSSASRSARSTSRPGRHSSTASRPRCGRCASASSASTSTFPTRTSRSSRRSKHGGFHHGADVQVDWIQAEDVEGLLAEGRLARPRRHRDPRGVRRAGHRGQDRRGQLRPREPHAVPRHLPRDAGDVHRVRAQRRRARGSQLERVRRHVPAPGHRPHGLAARGRRHGRHDAARRVLRGAAARFEGDGRVRRADRLRAPSASLRVQPRVPHAHGRGGPRSARARRPTAGSSSSSSSPTIRGGSARRPIPSSRAGPIVPVRCSATSSVLPCARAEGRNPHLLSVEA